MDFEKLDKESYNKGVVIAKEISNTLNSSMLSQQNNFMKGFNETLRRDHRSLQYDEIMLFVKAIGMFAECGTDARNEQAVKLAKVMSDAIKEKYGIEIKDL